MKNILGREGLDNPFKGAFANKKNNKYNITKNVTPVFGKTLAEVLDEINPHDGMTVSFHHHLRNGDYVLDMVMREFQKRGIKDITVMASSIFPCHEILVDLMKDGTVTGLITSYMSGPVAKAVSRGECKNPVIMTTHGGRPRMILEKEVCIDAAFLAAPAVDDEGNISGSEGKSFCGSLGYAVADAQCAKHTVAITDYRTKKVKNADIKGCFVNTVVEVERIGDPTGIVSGTTQITKDPIGLKIARNCRTLIEHSGLFKNGFSMQTGAGGISLAVANEMYGAMKEKNIKGSFASGGITGYFVKMLEEGLFENLYDVQCFDLAAVDSTEKNAGSHHKISADMYANPNNPEHVAGKLDVVILGASEIDLDFNVNVTTGSDGIILGGSGGHADTAAGAKLSIIVSKLFNARVSCLVEKVRTVTTPGETIDAFVTERGIAINPKHSDLIKKLKEETDLEIKTMEELKEIVEKFTGKPKVLPRSEEIIGISTYRDGTVLDVINKV
ncbi:citrate lyase subunit alpha [Treponema pedis]|uniref:citrate lyase subunit alpha n=1 Tax=Treponema pedis TaxID=409322 RepID=UPI00197EAD2B|nr:citrate lyase subunit alpha [Treponema pedis]QSI05327.1 citrate lyase subunit alpha [Treponema pedis]